MIDTHEDEKERYLLTGRLPRSRFKFTRGLSGLVLRAVAVSLLWLTLLVQSYLGFTGEIKVAYIRAMLIASEILWAHCEHYRKWEQLDNFHPK